MASTFIRPTTISETTSARHRAKFANKNLIHRWSLNNFFETFAGLIAPLEYSSVLDFGCGEGFCLQELASRNVCKQSAVWTGLDLREDAIECAREQFPMHEFLCMDIFDSELDRREFDLIICSQVLEHLPSPEKYVERLVSLSPKYLLFSVPHEPWFMLMNLLRGRDIRQFGNHPEHINHWSSRSLQKFLSPYVEVREIRRPFPFLISLCELRNSAQQIESKHRFAA